MKNILTILFIATLSLTSCTKSHDAGNDAESKDLLFASLLAANTTAKDYCLSAVVIMNQCVGEGGGFNPIVMCSAAQLALHTSAEYSALITCTSAAVQSTYCNFPQNRVADARNAVTNFFSACNTSSATTATNKIIQSGLRP